MDLSVIIVSWRVKEKLNQCLARLFLSQTNFSFEVFVVDNNSQDGSIEMIKDNFPQVKLIVNQDNIGFSRAVKQAYRQATGDFIFLLNPDNFVTPDTIDNFLRWMKENNQAALAGCRLVDQNNQDIKGQVRRFPEIFTELAIILKVPYFFPGVLDDYLCVNFDYNKPAQVDSVRGSAMMIRRSALVSEKILDERFFIWFEDVDLCRTFKAEGKEVWYTPAAVCTDLVGQSFSQVSRIKAQKYFRDSMLKYFKKWQPAWQYFILWLAWPIGLLITFIFTTLKFKTKNNT